MAEIIKTILLISCIGTLFAGVLILLRPVTKKIFSSNWHYYMWLGVLITMMFPLKLDVPVLNNPKDIAIEQVVVQEQNQIITEEPDIATNDIVTMKESAPVIQNKTNTKFDFEVLFYIWIIGFILVVLIKIISYLVFLIKIHFKAQAISLPEIIEYTNRKIKVYESDNICSPLMVGILRPTLVLPKTSITKEQLEFILKHETTHLKRHDILYKWLLSFVKCVHWFNPFIYVVSGFINLDCEISCDMSVVKEFDDKQTNGYVETILALLSANNKRQIPLTTGMTGNKNSLKKRFVSIKKNIRISKKMKIISLLVAVFIVVSTIYVSGIINGSISLSSSHLLDVEMDERNGNEFNILMIGVDEKEKADTVILFNYDGKILTGMVIPRNVDLLYTEDSYTRTVSHLLTKENGDQKVIDTLKSLLGIPIHYYARVNIQAVEDIVDSIGGVKLNVPYNMQYDDPAQDLHINLTEGEQLLNGEQIGNLLRFRDRQRPNSEEIRVMTWHSVTEEFLNQAIYGNKLTSPAKLYEVIAENVKTNYSMDDLVLDIESFKKLDRNNIVIENIPGRNVTAYDGYFVYRINMVEAEPLLEVFNSSRNGAKHVPAVTYTNERLGFKIRFPENWKSRYRIVENDNQVDFFHKEIYLKYGKGAGKLFSVKKVYQPFESGEPNDYLYQANDYAYIWSVPSDVQQPIWDNNDKEDEYLAKDYEDMLIDLEFIKNSFELNETQQKEQTNTVVYNYRNKKMPDISREGVTKIKSSTASDIQYSGFKLIEIDNTSSEQIQAELNKQGISIADSASADLSDNYVVGKYSYENNLNIIHKNISSDNNGNISVYFDINTDNLVDVNFYDEETNKDVGGYIILANKEKAYTFMGFDPDKTYSVDIQGETENNWKVEGEYIIY